MVRFWMINGKGNAEVYNLINKAKLDVVSKPIAESHGLPNECYTSQEYTKIERKKPSLNEIIDSDSIKPNDDNDFVDVLAAIEEEMTAVRELYVGGYISKGVYIAETDRLYEKAKIFGL